MRGFLVWSGLGSRQGLHASLLQSLRILTPRLVAHLGRINAQSNPLGPYFSSRGGPNTQIVVAALVALLLCVYLPKVQQQDCAGWDSPLGKETALSVCWMCG